MKNFNSWLNDLTVEIRRQEEIKTFVEKACEDMEKWDLPKEEEKVIDMENNNTYNGHPSYNHWNVALWFSNDEGLYNLVVEGFEADQLVALLPETPDGVEVTEELAQYAIDCIKE